MNHFKEKVKPKDGQVPQKACDMCGKMCYPTQLFRLFRMRVCTGCFQTESRRMRGKYDDQNDR